MSEQVFNASGLVREPLKINGLALAGSKLGGRYDSREMKFHARLDAAERTYVDTALGVLRGLFRQRLDTAESAFVQRALVFVDGQPYAALIPPLESRTFVPTSVKGKPGDEMYVYRTYRRTGMARFFAPGAALDLPRANFYQREVNQRYYPLGAKIVYNYFELLAIGASLANGQPVDLVGESLKAALEAVEKKIDLVAAFGTAAPPSGLSVGELDMDTGLTGLVNAANATAYVLATGASSGTTPWSGKSAMEIYLDLIGIVGGQYAGTYKVHRPDTILVPPAQFTQQLTRPMTDLSTVTIIEFFTNTMRAMGNPVEIKSWDYLSGAGNAGADLMIAYKRDPAMFEHVLAMDATPLPAAPNSNGLEMTQPVVAKTAGVVMRYPLSVSIASGI